MSFRKRNVGLASSHQRGAPVASTSPAERVPPAGIRPSAIDGRPTTSTGTATLDGLLAGHAGLALDTSLLLEENGTTDYAGALLRFYAAEGLVQGHHVHLVGLPEPWGRELPGVVGETGKTPTGGENTEKMKIAWRYERLGQFGTDAATRDRVPVASSAPGSESATAMTQTFCHTFDLSKRLVHPPSSVINSIAVEASASKQPFDIILDKLSVAIEKSATNIVHRIIVPSLLSPALYPPHACLPHNLLKFQHGIRALLARYPGRVTVMQSLPLSLFPRSNGMVRWLEVLNDGVIELAPFPHSADADFHTSRDPTTKEEQPQGLLRIHKLPIFHDRGSGIVASDNDWTFTLSRRKFAIKPYNLPPIEGDTEAQQTPGGDTKAKQQDLEF